MDILGRNVVCIPLLVLPFNYINLVIGYHGTNSFLFFEWYLISKHDTDEKN